MAASMAASMAWLDIDLYKPTPGPRYTQNHVACCFMAHAKVGYLLQKRAIEILTSKQDKIAFGDSLGWRIFSLI